MATNKRSRDIALEFGVSNRKILGASEHEDWGGFYRFYDTETVGFVEEHYQEFAGEAWVGDLLLRPSVVVVLPGKEIPEHYHRNRVEIIKVLGGTMALSTVSRCGLEEKHLAGEGDLLRLEHGVIHTMRAGDEPLVMAEVWGRRLPGVETDHLDTVFTRV